VIASAQLILIILIPSASALLASRYALRQPADTAWFVGLTLIVGLALWITCDKYLLHALPTVWWFDPREPFAPYFLLYLPLSLAIAVTPAAAVMVIARRCFALIQRQQASPAE
jgi:hypothetical protein